mgnify:CR=1 FL=1
MKNTLREELADLTKGPRPLTLEEYRKRRKVVKQSKFEIPKVVIKTRLRKIDIIRAELQQINLILGLHGTLTKDKVGELKAKKEMLEAARAEKNREKRQKAQIRKNNKVKLQKSDN